MFSTSSRSAKARLAANMRHHPDSDHTESRRELKAATLAEHIGRIMAEAPPLTTDQRERIAALLTPTRGVGK